MIVEAFLNVIKWILFGIILILPKFPTIELKYLDGVFQVLSMVDLIVNVRVLAACLGILFAVLNIQFIWAIIMWVIRKIPGMN